MVEGESRASLRGLQLRPVSRMAASVAGLVPKMYPAPKWAAIPPAVRPRTSDISASFRRPSQRMPRPPQVQAPATRQGVADPQTDDVAAVTPRPHRPLTTTSQQVKSLEKGARSSSVDQEGGDGWANAAPIAARSQRASPRGRAWARGAPTAAGPSSRPARPHP